jgi:hypothetical protein
MKIREVSNWTELPAKGMQVYSPTFRDMNLEQILKEMSLDNDWEPYGYNYALFSRDISTVHLYRSI